MTDLVKLKCFASLLGIKIRFINQRTMCKKLKSNVTAGDACFDAETWTVFIGPNVLKKALPFVIAHELGHAMDNVFLYKNKGLRGIMAQSKNYMLFHALTDVGATPSRLNRRASLRLETAASDWGERILKLLDIKVNKKIIKKVRSLNEDYYR